MRTEKSILTLISLSFLAIAIFTSYNTPFPKTEDSVSMDTVYLADMENYKEQVANNLSASYRSMEEFNVRLEIEKNKNREDFRNTMAKIEQKNNELKMRLSEYKANGKNEGESFKKKFDHDLSELRQWFQNVTVKMSNSHDNNLSPRFVKP